MPGQGLITGSLAPPTDGAGTPRPIGTLFGFVACATQDLGNPATLGKWPIRLHMSDKAWSTLPVGVSASARRTGLRSNDRPGRERIRGPGCQRLQMLSIASGNHTERGFA